VRTHEIKSGAIPNLDLSIKKLINHGIWYFYQIQKENDSSARYLLKAEDLELLYNAAGDLISELNPNNGKITYEKSILFSDLEYPSTPSNLVS